MGELANRRRWGWTPWGLTLLRLALAPTMLAIAYTSRSPAALVVCVIVGVLSDIFDGILARRLGVVTPGMRRLDSGTDVIFFLSAAWCVWVTQPEIVQAHRWGLGLLIGLEITCNLVSFARFGRPPATHSYLAKAWGLCLLTAFVAALGFGYGGWVMVGAIVMGCLADAEVIAIMLVSRGSAVDVPTIWHALRPRRQQTAGAIRRNRR